MLKLKIEVRQESDRSDKRDISIYQDNLLIAKITCSGAIECVGDSKVNLSFQKEVLLKEAISFEEI